MSFDLLKQNTNALVAGIERLTHKMDKFYAFSRIKASVEARNYCAFPSEYSDEPICNLNSMDLTQKLAKLNNEKPVQPRMSMHELLKVQNDKVIEKMESIREIQTKLDIANFLKNADDRTMLKQWTRLAEGMDVADKFISQFEFEDFKDYNKVDSLNKSQRDRPEMPSPQDLTRTLQLKKLEASFADAQDLAQIKRTKNQLVNKSIAGPFSMTMTLGKTDQVEDKTKVVKDHIFDKLKNDNVLRKELSSLVTLYESHNHYKSDFYKTHENLLKRINFMLFGHQGLESKYESAYSSRRITTTGNHDSSKISNFDSHSKKAISDPRRPPLYQPKIKEMTLQIPESKVIMDESIESEFSIGDGNYKAKNFYDEMPANIESSGSHHLLTSTITDTAPNIDLTTTLQIEKKDQEKKAEILQSLNHNELISSQLSQPMGLSINKPDWTVKHQEEATQPQIKPQNQLGFGMPTTESSVRGNSAFSQMPTRKQPTEGRSKFENALSKSVNKLSKDSGSNSKRRSSQVSNLNRSLVMLQKDSSVIDPDDMNSSMKLSEITFNRNARASSVYSKNSNSSKIDALSKLMTPKQVIPLKFFDKQIVLEKNLTTLDRAVKRIANRLLSMAFRAISTQKRKSNVMVSNRLFRSLFFIFQRTKRTGFLGILQYAKAISDLNRNFIRIANAMFKKHVVNVFTSLNKQFQKEFEITRKLERVTHLLETAFKEQKFKTFNSIKFFKEFRQSLLKVSEVGDSNLKLSDTTDNKLDLLLSKGPVPTSTEKRYSRKTKSGVHLKNEFELSEIVPEKRESQVNMRPSQRMSRDTAGEWNVLMNYRDFLNTSKEGGLNNVGRSSRNNIQISPQERVQAPMQRGEMTLKPPNLGFSKLRTSNIVPPLDNSSKFESNPFSRHKDSSRSDFEDSIMHEHRRARSRTPTMISVLSLVKDLNKQLKQLYEDDKISDQEAYNIQLQSHMQDILQTIGKIKRRQSNSSRSELDLSKIQNGIENLLHQFAHEGKFEKSSATNRYKNYDSRQHSSYLQFNSRNDSRDPSPNQTKRESHYNISPIHSERDRNKKYENINQLLEILKEKVDPAKEGVSSQHNYRYSSNNHIRNSNASSISPIKKQPVNQPGHLEHPNKLPSLTNKRDIMFNSQTLGSFLLFFFKKKTKHFYRDFFKSLKKIKEWSKNFDHFKRLCGKIRRKQALKLISSCGLFIKRRRHAASDLLLMLGKRSKLKIKKCFQQLKTNSKQTKIEKLNITSQNSQATIRTNNEQLQGQSNRLLQRVNRLGSTADLMNSVVIVSNTSNSGIENDDFYMTLEAEYLKKVAARKPQNMSFKKGLQKI